MAAGKQSRPTLKTIADLTGLSMSTVSLCLRDGSALKAETRQKVAEAARQVGYVPNRAGVRLRTGKTNVLSLVLDGDEGSVDFTRQLMKGIGTALSGTAYHLNVLPDFDHSASIESVRYILENRTSDGVIVTHTAARDPRVQMLMDADLPFVTYGRTEFFTPHPFHDFDSDSFVRLAVDRLIQQGRRNILLVAPNLGTCNDHRIRTVFQHYTAECGIFGAVISRAHTLEGQHDLEDLCQEVLQSSPKPDGMLFVSELTAIAMVASLQKNGWVLGRDFDAISKKTSDLLPTLFPDLGTISEDVYSAGHELVRLLLARIEGDEPETLQSLGAPNLTARA